MQNLSKLAVIYAPSLGRLWSTEYVEAIWTIFNSEKTG